MKNKAFLFIICLFASIFLSCSDDEDKVTEVKHIKVSVFYSTKDAPSTFIPDVKAKVFFYYNITNTEFLDSTNEGNGKFIRKNGELIQPDQETTINADGTSFLLPTYRNVDVMVIAESDYYRGRLSHTAYHRWESFTATFKFQP